MKNVETALPKLLFCNLKNWQFGWSEAEPGNLLLLDYFGEFYDNLSRYMDVP